MEERGIGEEAFESFPGEVQSQEVLVPDVAARVRTGHFAEGFASIEPGRQGAPLTQRLEVAPGPTAEIKHALPLPCLRQAGKQGLDVLGDVVIPSAFPEGIRSVVVVS